MTAATTDLVAGRTLVSEELFELLTTDIIRNEGLKRELATRIVDQALEFLATAARHPDALLRPSKQVDLGWHAFVLHTAAYQEFCQRVAGWFIHHEPTDDTLDGPQGRDAVGRTVAAIRDAGYVVDGGVWNDAASCGETGCGAGRPPADR